MRLVDLQLLLLIIIANGTPVMAARLFGSRYAWPLDGNRCLRDGRPLFGKSKTWRGILCAIVATTAAAVLLNLTWWLGTLIALCAMLGDLLTSFTKRRFGLKSSSMALGLDQIPEALLPLLAVKTQMTLSWADIVSIVIAFTVLTWLASPLLYRLHIRKRPY